MYDFDGFPKPPNSVGIPSGEYISNRSPSVLLFEAIKAEAAEIERRGLFRATEGEFFGLACLYIERHPKESSPLGRLLGSPLVPCVIIWVLDRVTVEGSNLRDPQDAGSRLTLDLVSARGDPEMQAVEVCEHLTTRLTQLAIRTEELP